MTDSHSIEIARYEMCGDRPPTARPAVTDRLATLLRNSSPLLITTLAMGIAACAGHDTKAADTTVPAIEFSWANCANFEAPYFRASAAQDGTFRFSGGGVAKELGSRVTSITPTGYKELEAILRKVLRSERGGGANVRHPPSAECLSITLLTSHQTAHIELSKNTAKRFNQRADEITGFKKLVCPLRGLKSGLDSDCPPPVIEYKFVTEAPCPSSHWVWVYKSGDILHTNGSGTLNDYFVISQPDVVALADAVLKYHVTGDEALQEVSGVPQFVRGTDSEISDFRNRLRTSSGINWNRAYTPQEVCAPHSLGSRSFQGISVNESTLDPKRYEK